MHGLGVTAGGAGDSAKGSLYLSVDYDHDVGQYMGIDGLTATLHYGRQEFEGAANDPYTTQTCLLA
jgi:hypothetical protein